MINAKRHFAGVAGALLPLVATADSAANAPESGFAFGKILGFMAFGYLVYRFVNRKK